jgi:outer membrane receptor for ferric coprogen and ferric-rhodotorulic acid
VGARLSNWKREEEAAAWTPAAYTIEYDQQITATNPATGLDEKVGEPTYGLLDLMARYAFDRHWALQLNVFSALDKTYRSGSFWWGAPYTYGEPRKILATLDYRV